MVLIQVTPKNLCDRSIKKSVCRFCSFPFRTLFSAKIKDCLLMYFSAKFYNLTVAFENPNYNFLAQGAFSLKTSNFMWIKRSRQTQCCFKAKTSRLGYSEIQVHLNGKLWTKFSETTSDGVSPSLCHWSEYNKFI